jgi:nucleotide-binding universal stress UspA family protein
MVMRVLVPVDFTELSVWAVELALEVVARHQGEVHLVHLVQAPAGALVDAQGQVLDDGEIDLTRYRQALVSGQESMDTWKTRFGVQGLVLSGALTSGILHESSRIGADCIVMGTEGTAGIRELLTRTEAGEGAIQSPVPVLTLKCDRSQTQFKSALLVDQFREVRRYPLGAVQELLGTDGQWSFMAMSANHLDQCDDRQARMEETAVFNGITSSVDFFFHRQGDEEIALTQLLQEKQFDVLCIGIPKRKLARWLSGDLALALVHHFHKPIYTFPMEDEG